MFSLFQILFNGKTNFFILLRKFNIKNNYGVNKPFIKVYHLFIYLFFFGSNVVIKRPNHYLIHSLLIFLGKKFVTMADIKFHETRLILKKGKEKLRFVRFRVNHSLGFFNQDVYELKSRTDIFYE